MVKVDNNKVPFLIDSGANINMIDKSTYANLKNKSDIKLLTSKKRIFAYGAKYPLPLEGIFYSNVSVDSTHDIAKIYVASANNSGCVLSRETATNLGLLKIVNKMSEEQNIPDRTSQIVSKHPNVFKGLGKLKNVQLKLDIDETVKPVAQHLRKTPYHVRKGDRENKGVTGPGRSKD